MINVEQISSQLRLVFYDGEDMATGKAIYRAKGFNNVKEEATAESLYAVAKAMETLQTRSLYTIERRDNKAISK